jgi:RNA polymerase sigma-70 factor (ECF subfamily)
MDRLRKRYTGPEVAEEILVEELVTNSPDPLPGTAAEVRGEVEALPVLEREVLELFYLQELSLREVAAVLDVPEGTVKSRLHRARGLLRARLEEKGIPS